MRIAQACPYDWGAAGGVQIHVRQLAAALRSRGHEVLVLAPGREPVPHEPGVRIVGRPVRIPYNGSVAPICPSPRSARVVRDALERFRPDLVHAHEPLTPSTGMFAALRSPAPVVATFHAYAERSALFAAAAPALRRVWRRLSIRVAVSEAACEFAERNMGDGIRIVPNGVDAELFGRAEPAAAAELPPGRRILFVNRLEPRKGLRVALRALPMVLERIPDAVLVVAGEGSERRAVGELPPAARDRVILLGHVPHDDLPPLHAASEAFVAPATGRESFGIVLVEAMASGLPIVASDIPGYREVARDGLEAVLVPPDDPVALGGALVRVLEDRSLAERLSRAGRERARDFSWENVAARLEEIYREVAA